MFLRVRPLAAVLSAAVLSIALLSCGSNQTGSSALLVDGGPPNYGDGGATGDGASGQTDGPAPGDGSAGSPEAAPPPSTCPETFTLPDDSYTTVQLETDYDAWTTGIPMAKNASGQWQVTTQ